MIKKILVVFLLCLFASLYAIGQNNQFVNKTDSLLKYLHENNRFCGTVLISKGSNILFHKTFPANGETEVKDQYRIASITKMFTAVLIYQLVEEKKLSLSDKLQTYYPQIPNSEKITIQQMLAHQSGIPDLINDDDFSSIQTKTMKKEDLIQLMVDYGSVFKPGEKTQYSNSNYLLLGFIIEEITKISYSDNIQSRINKPLGLTQTYVESATEAQSRKSGYQFNGAEWIKTSVETNATVSAAAGAIISSPNDLNIFIQQLFASKLINKAHLDTMCKLTNKTYGHGIFYTPFEKHIGFGHTGHIDEFRSAVTYFEEDSLCIVLCLNGLNYPMNDIALGVLSYYFERDYKFPAASAIQMGAEQLIPFEGIYRLKLFHFIPITKIKIESENGVLVTAALKNYEAEKSIAEPIGTNTFKNFQYRSTLTFEYKKNGKVKGCFFQQGKSKLYCKKLRQGDPVA